MVRMSEAQRIIVSFVGGPADGLEQPLDPRDSLDSMLGETFLVGSAEASSQSIYRTDDAPKPGGRLYARFVKHVAARR